MPKKPSEIGQIKKTFLDPTGSHLLITTTLGENYSLNYQSTKAKQLSRLKGLHITSVAWNPARPTRTTGEILLGTSDGSIYETLIEPSDEYFKKEDRYVKHVYKTQSAITGLHYLSSLDKSIRKIIACTQSGHSYFWQGKVSSLSTSDGIPILPKFFEREEPSVEQFDPAPDPTISIAPKPTKPPRDFSPAFGWLTGIGILHGNIPLTDDSVKAKEIIYKDANLFLATDLEAGSGQLKSLVLTEYHMLLLAGTTLYGINRLNSKIVFKETIKLEPQESLIGLCSDSHNSTYWAFTTENIFEIVVTDEDREIWKTFLDNRNYEEAIRLAKDQYAKDVACVAYGEYSLEQKDYMKAAQLLGTSSKSFESVALNFMEAKQYNALLLYLSTRLKGLNKTSKLQRTLLASWILELYMEKLNTLDDSAAANEEPEKETEVKVNGKITQKSSGKSTTVQEESLDVIKSFQDFVTTYHSDLDKSIVYEVIYAHSRREELLFYASTINDTNFVINYWIRLERWAEALKVLQVENDPNLYYKYSTVLLVNSPKATVDTWMRNTDLDPAKFIPALLNYVKGYRPNGTQTNQAIRYLKFCINKVKNTDPIIHNTLIALYASNPALEEAQLVAFLEEHSSTPYYDTDFALRLFTRYDRVQSSVHIYSSMGLYDEAVSLALKSGNVDLASIVADRPIDDPPTRKSLWMQVAEYVIVKQQDGYKQASDLLEKCELLKIEDLLPLFPDFTVVDDFKKEIISSMNMYSSNINQLNKEMEESVDMAKNIKNEIQRFEKRYALIEPGEKCFLCDLPVATKKFYVFPCLHTFHCDCLLENVLKSSDYKTINKIRDIRQQGSSAARDHEKPNGDSKTQLTKDQVTAEIDKVLLASCVLCGEARIDSIDAPLIQSSDRALASEWAL